MIAHLMLKKTTLRVSPFARYSKFDFWKVSWLALVLDILKFWVDLGIGVYGYKNVPRGIDMSKTLFLLDLPSHFRGLRFQ